MGKINQVKLVWFFCVIFTSMLSIIELPSRKALSQSVEIFSPKIDSQIPMNVSQITVEREQKKQTIDDQQIQSWIFGSVLSLTVIVAIGCRFFSLRSYRALQQIEKALRESEARYRAIIEDQTELICRFLPDGTLTFVNDAYCRYFQKERSELVNHTFLPLIPEEDQKKLAQNIASICLNKPIITHEHRVILNNEICWQQWTNRAIFDANGQVIEYQAVGRDITALKAAEAEIRSLNLELEQRIQLRTQDYQESQIALEKAYQQLAFHVENTPLSVIEWDENCKIKYWSSQAEKIFGWKAEEVIGLHWEEWKFVHEADRQNVNKIISDLIVNKKPRNFNSNRNYTKEGKVLECEWYNSILLDSTGQLVSILSLVLDISKRKKTEVIVEQQKELLQSIVDNIPVMITFFDPEHNFQWVNQAWENILGWKLEEIKGFDILSECYPNAEEQQTVIDFIQTAAGTWQDFRTRIRDGQTIGTSWANIRLSNGSLIGIGQDITKRKQMEAALKESEAKYRLLFEANPNPLWVFDLETLKFLEVNEAAIRHYGYSREEFLRMTIVDLQPLEDIPNLPQIEDVKPDGDDHYDYGFWKHKKQNGEIIYVEILAQKILFEGRSAKIIMATDITARVGAEKALSQSEERFRRAITDAPLPIIIHAEDGEVIQINQTWTDLSGYTHAEIPTIADWTEKAYGERKEMAQSALDQLYAINSRIEEGEFLIRDATGKERVWNFCSAPLGTLPDGRRQVISMAIDITERKEAEERLRYDALHDSVTGLPNRVFLMKQVEECLQRAKLHPNYLFAVLFVDLDRFKVVNDSLGHLVGDQLLVAIAHKLKECIRDRDIVARLGGDEFVIILEQLRETQEAVSVAQRICQTLASPFTVNSQEFFVTASIGIAFNSCTNLEANDILRNADLAMYRAKESGKARYAIFDPEMHIKISRQLELETNLRVALDRQEFLVYYQPIMSLQTLTLIGFEALVRWQHPKQGLIYPSEFIPIAEETGLIVPLGEWVLNESCRQVKEWQTEFPQITSVQISVNLSNRQLQQLDLIQTIDSILARTGLVGSCLKLEITESLLMQNPETAIHTLLKLKERQISISIDDFGTGYSSLSYLHRLPVDTLKIDRSFVSHMNEDGENLDIVEAIINLAHHLGVTVIAEGVESQEHFTKLKELGCESGQGYFFSRPMNAQNIKRFLQDRIT